MAFQRPTREMSPTTPYPAPRDLARTPVRLARLIPPRPPTTWITRDRLLARLDAIGSGVVIAIVAPPGFGKSSLVAEWTTTRGIRAAWLTLDEADNDLPTLVAHLVAALRRVAPRFGARTLVLVGSTPSPDPQVLGQAFADDLFDLAGDIRMVLDGVHAITSAPSRGFLELLLRYPSPGVSLVITSRQPLEAPIPLLRARGAAIELTCRDLALTPPETGVLLNQAIGFEVPASLVDRLHEQTAGWPALLRILLSHAPADASPGDLEDVLAGEALDDMAAIVASDLTVDSLSGADELLLWTSVTEDISPDLADALVAHLSPPPDCHRLLLQLQRQGLYLSASPDRPGWSRQQPGIRRINLRRLEQLHGSRAIIRQHMTAATWSMHHAPGTAAISHALRAGDVGAAVRMTVAFGLDAVASERWMDIGHLLDQLPPDIGDHDPGILTLRAWRLWHEGTIGAVATSVARAQEALATSPSDPRTSGHLAAMASALAIAPPDIDRARAALDKVTMLLPSDDSVGRGLALQSLSLAAAFAGDPASASALIRRHLGSRAPVDRAVSARALTALANIAYYSDHDLHAMRAHLVDAARASTTHNLPITHAVAQAWLTIIASLRAEFDAVNDTPFVHQSDPGSLPLMVWREFRYCRALALAWEGEHQAAAEIADTLVEVLASRSGPERLHNSMAFRARLALLAGDVELALHWALGATSDTMTDVPMMLETPAIVAIRALVASGDPGHLASAAGRADIAIETARSVHHRPFLAIALATRAMIRHAAGDLAGALEDIDLPLADLSRNRAPLRMIELGPSFASLLDNVPETHPGRSASTLLARQIRGGRTASVDWTELDLDPGLHLTARELEVLTLMAIPLSNKAIADTLHISPTTVKHHVANLLAKLGGANRRDAVHRAHTLGLVSAAPGDRRPPQDQ